MKREREREREREGGRRRVYVFRQRHEGRGGERAEERVSGGGGRTDADVDVASSICADRAITMKKKGLDSRGRRGPGAWKNAAKEGEERTEWRDDDVPTQNGTQANSRLSPRGPDSD